MKDVQAKTAIPVASDFQLQEINLKFVQEVCLEFTGLVESAVFVRRLHRFAAEVDKDGKIIVAHVPNSSFYGI